jgi:PAS domain S-box-containing protein
MQARDRGSQGREARLSRPLLARDLAWMLLLGIAYYLAAKGSLRLALIERNITPLWPPSGIALVAFLLFGKRVWPGVALGAFLVNLPISDSAVAAGTTALGNTAAPLLGAWLLERVGFHPEIDRARDVFAIVGLAALLGMVVSATIGAGTLVATGAVPWDQALEAWSVWWAGDAMGVVVVAPFLLWLSGLHRHPRPSLARQSEALVLLIVLIATCVVAARSRLPFFFLIPPIVGWIAWRFQQAGAATATLLVSSIVTWAAANTRGPFADQPLFQKMLVLQAFNATVAFTAFFLAALVTERTRSREVLERAAGRLESRVEQRTAELAEAQEMARIGRWEWNLATDTVSWSDEMFRIHGAVPGAYDVTFEKATELVLEDDRERITSNTRTALERGDSELPDIEYQIVLPNGELRVLLGKARIFTGESGEPSRMVGVVQDVTERRDYQRQHRIADTLQRALLPKELPRPDGFELAARYLPAEAGLTAGGDWYDVVPLPDGSIAVVIGDVAGHGLDAASLMGQLRLAIRAYALEGHPPEIVVTRADALLQQMAPEVMVTLLYVQVDAATNEAHVVNAGHPPFGVFSPGRGRYAGGASAPPMGFASFTHYEAAVEPLEPGSTLLLYTDGLIDRPDMKIDDGMRRMLDIARAQPDGDLGGLCDEVISELVGGELSDDVAMLAVRAIPSAERFHLRIPAVPQELVRVRRGLSRWLAASDLPREPIDDVVLASSEACANAVKHAYGPADGEIDVEGAMRGSSVLVTVRDFGRWRDARGGDGGRGLDVIDSCMSLVTIERGPEGTEVHMRKDLETVPGSG